MDHIHCHAAGIQFNCHCVVWITTAESQCNRAIMPRLWEWDKRVTKHLVSA